VNHIKSGYYVAKGTYMFRQPVNSSNLRSVGYMGGILEIEFHSGGVYQYFNVPESIYLGLMAASSHGIYFHMFIKNRFGYARVA
jgi:hypothetical protein